MYVCVAYDASYITAFGTEIDTAVKLTMFGRPTI